MDIIHEFEINTTIEHAFNAFTTESGINGWWSGDCDIPNQAGEILRVRFTEHNVEMGFRIDELIPNSKAHWTCVENPNPSFLDTKITFEVEESKNSVLFKFSHSNWDEQWRGKINYEQSVGTWIHFMDSLKNYLETGIGQPW